MRTLALAIASAALAACGDATDYGDGGAAPAQCTAATAIAPASNTIVLDGNAFSPACAKVSAGTTVTFDNQDGMQHTVTADGQFDSGLLDPAETYVRTFESAGTVRIRCTVHPGMEMTLVVE